MTITQNIRTNTRVIRASYANKNRVTQAQFRIETEEIDLNSVKPGGIILRNLYLSLDPCKVASNLSTGAIKMLPLSNTLTVQTLTSFLLLLFLLI
jgi:NADPH-dependent curcumin reductase CurA